MALRYLLDTNICIYIAKAHPAEVLARFKRLRPGDVGMSAITYGELAYGARKSRYRADAERILRDLTAVIPAIEMGEKSGECYGMIRAHLEREGLRIGNNDLWIAAHALGLGVPLVTNNEKEFAPVPDLVVQNWVKRAEEVHESPRVYKTASRRRRGGIEFPKP